MKINASHSDELILQMEVRQHEHGQVYIPGFNQLLVMPTCDTKAFAFFGFPEPMRSTSLILYSVFIILMYLSVISQPTAISLSSVNIKERSNWWKLYSTALNKEALYLVDIIFC